MESNNPPKTDSENANPQPQEVQKSTPNQTEPILTRDENMKNKVHPQTNSQVIGVDPLVTKGESLQKENEGSQHREIRSPQETPLSPPNEKSVKGL